MLTTYHQRAKLKLVATVLSILVVSGGVVVADHIKPKVPTLATTPSSTQPTPQATSSTPTTSGTSTAQVSSPYKDGTYSATSSYSVPHSDQSIKVTLSLKNGVIASASVQNSEGDSTSASYQESFASEYKSSVVGQNISGLNLDVISGASDTTRGFDEALRQIASQAQS